MNPYLPSWEYIPDGEPRVFDGRLYVFGSHDRFDAVQYCVNDYVFWSAPIDDLGSWTRHEVAYRKEQDPSNASARRALWAPDVARGADGRFYLYYGIEFEPMIGVAVAEHPAGPYEFLAHVAYENGHLLGGRDGDAFPFDPAVLVDDDGRVYLYFGFAPVAGEIIAHLPPGLRREGAYAVELAADMTTVVGEPTVIAPGAGSVALSGFEGHEFFEASSIRRIGSTYYFVYSSINGHELCHATSDLPTGGFSYRGVLVSNGDIGIDGRKDEDALNYTGNNHGGLVSIGGQWFVFHHRHTNRQQAARQGLAEALRLNPDGSFDQAEMSSTGLRNAPFPGEGRYSAAIACVLRGPEGAGPSPFYTVDTTGGEGEHREIETRLVSLFGERRGEHPYLTQTGGDREQGPDQYVANMRDGAVVGFRSFDLSRTTRVSVEVDGDADGVIEVRTELDGDPVVSLPLSVSLPPSGTIPAQPGDPRGLYFTYRGPGSVDFLSFTLAGALDVRA